MSFGTYTAFTTAVAAWMDVNTSDVSSVISDVVTVAENRIFREARTRDMETSFSTAMSAGLIAVPSDYVEMKFAYVNTDPVTRLERRDEEWIYEHYPDRVSGSVPKYFAREATNFIFGPFPDSTYTMNAVYYKRLAAISGAALNGLFTNNEDLYLFACLAEAELIIGRDPRIPIWEAKYKNILQAVNGEDARERASGSTLQMRPASSGMQMKVRA